MFIENGFYLGKCSNLNCHPNKTYIQGVDPLLVAFGWAVFVEKKHQEVEVRSA
jgi:hypothetical protein